jgi:asparagine synthase (glutamine-hydrolysing)
MCGISGIYSEKIEPKAISLLCKQMLELINHRGPDEKGIINHQFFSCGVARLSIEAIHNGKQPIENDRYIIGFNGEIFNYKSLIQKYNFSNKIINCEIKLLLKLWELKHTKFVNEIKGQYAIFIFDKLNNEIYLFRDPYGIRPLFYYHEKNSLVFASEIKSIIRAVNNDFQVDVESLKQISMFWTNIGKQTSVKGISELEPGSCLVWKSGQVNSFKFYKEPLLEICNYNYSKTDAKKSFFSHLNNSVEKQLHGEVGFAIYLSGGIDSAAIAYILSKKSKKPLDTFSISFQDSDYDESEAQRQISKFLGTHHSEIKIKNSDISNNFSKVIDHCETLLFRTAPVPLFLLSKHVRNSGHKVVYTGEGADEMLLGYDIFFENRIRKFWSKDINSKYRGELLRRLYHYLPQFKNSRYFKIAKDFYKKTLKNDDNNFFYSHLVRWSQLKQIASYFNLPSSEILENKLIEKFKHTIPDGFSKVNGDVQAQYLEISTLLSNYLLSSQGDRMAMANSIESRYPYLDEDFVKYCSLIDPKIKAPIISSKKLLREAFKDKLPKNIISRPKVAYQALEAKCFINNNFVSENVQNFIENMDKIDVINKKNFSNLIDKIKNPFSSQRLGFRENMAFIIGLSYFNLNNSIKKWQFKQ